MKNYDVIVVGAGHAGCEAALACARLGVRTLMLVIKYESIGRMSCNPTIGGPAKGHLAREIDALGGEQGYAADVTGIQFRMLNQKKGPAVWAPRCQNDRSSYSMFMRQAVEGQENLHLLEDEVTQLIVEKGEIKGVITLLGASYYAPKVILANGTFLKGTIHVGKVSYAGGRSGEPASSFLSQSLLTHGLKLGRFKTGTPPRVNLQSLDFSKLERQPGDVNPSGFSYYKDVELKNLVDCYLTYTNQRTHRIIGDNIKKSSLYGGYITGTGPRYCPSIEDKVIKFAGKEMHHVFIEPEGIHTNEAYVNGVSNSLPCDVQEEIIHSLAGLEKAVIVRYGYAIEYDYVLSGQIKSTLESNIIKGLYLAGQINGTSGYEEAAGQGIVAGINACLALDKKEAFIPDRAQSYLGVLIDDLVTCGTNEPYRLFTSRAEYRLHLRQDNADDRLMPMGYKLGLVKEAIWQKYLQQKAIYERELSFLKNTNTKKHPLQNEPIKLAILLKRPEIEFEQLSAYGYTPPADVTPAIRNRLALEIKYEGYLKRQEEDIARYNKYEHLKLPFLDYMQIKTIAYEAREKLNRLQPTNIGQAGRIPGVNPSDLTALIVWLKKNELTKKGTA